MVYFQEIEFQINKGADGNIDGFSLLAKPDVCAEAYCLSFPHAFIAKKATLEIKDGKIIFYYQGIDVSDTLNVFGISEGGIFTAEIPPEDLEVMTQIVERTGRFANVQIGIRHEFAWKKGFTAYLKK